jgi:hypothetical protein
VLTVVQLYNCPLVTYLLPPMSAVNFRAGWTPDPTSIPSYGSTVGSYTPCKLARDGEREKWARWNGAVSAHRDFTAGATFVPLSVEVAGGGFGPQAERFVETIVEWAGNVRDVSIFGWQAAEKRVHLNIFYL